MRAQTAGYHRRDLDALREAGGRYAQLDPAARAAFLARLSSVLASLQWCGPRMSERLHTQPVLLCVPVTRSLPGGWRACSDGARYFKDVRSAGVVACARAELCIRLNHSFNLT